MTGRCQITPATVKQLRTELGLTQKQFANLLNVMPYVISNWETGKHRPTGAAAMCLELLIAADRGPRSQGTEPEGEAVSIGALVEAITWVDSNAGTSAGLTCFKELVESIRRAIQTATKKTAGEAEALEAAALAAAVVQHCRRLVDDAAPESPTGRRR